MQITATPDKAKSYHVAWQPFPKHDWRRGQHRPTTMSDNWDLVRQSAGETGRVTSYSDRQTAIEVFNGPRGTFKESESK